MAKAICVRDCYPNPQIGYCMRNEEKDINPEDPWAVHFSFEKPKDQEVAQKTAAKQVEKAEAARIEQAEKNVMEELSKKRTDEAVLSRVMDKFKTLTKIN